MTDADDISQVTEPEVPATRLATSNNSACASSAMRIACIGLSPVSIVIEPLGDAKPRTGSSESENQLKMEK